MCCWYSGIQVTIVAMEDMVQQKLAFCDIYSYYTTCNSYANNSKKMKLNPFTKNTIIYANQNTFEVQSVH